MLINPEENIKFKEILNELYEKCEFLVPVLSLKARMLDEYKWSIVLDYLLIKSLGENILNSYLIERIPEYFDVFVAFTLPALQDPENKVVKRLPEAFKDIYFSFFEDYLINPYILRKSLFTMRTAADLNILFTLFGGEFFPQEQEIYDGTGSLYFTKKDFQPGSNMSKKKIEILNTHLQNNENEGINVIALNLGHHWVAINSINDTLISFNDPNSGRTGKLRINKRTPDRYRFYLYNYKIESALILKKHIKAFLIFEIEDEQENLEIFATQLFKTIEEQPEVAAINLALESESEEREIQSSEKLETSIDSEKKEPIKPLSGERFMERIRKKIREQFSDYSKL